jgi:D-lactate dehydrogenase (cytochrome)
MLYNDKQRKQAEEIVHRMIKRAIAMEGTVTGEHGVGLVKRDYLNHELGETTVDAMRRVCPHFPFLSHSPLQPLMILVLIPRL